MANLWSGNVENTDEYQNLESVSGLTLTEGSSYQIQIEGGAYLREGTTGRGFSLYDSKPFTLVKTSSDVYIEPMSDSCFVNIAE